MAEPSRKWGVKCPRCHHVRPAAVTPGPGVYGNTSNCTNCGLIGLEDTAKQFDFPFEQPVQFGSDVKWKFVKSADVRRGWRDLRSKLHEPAIQQAVESFKVNMDQVGAIVALPVFLVGRAVTINEALSEAASRLRDKPEAERLGEKLRAEVNRVLTERSKQRVLPTESMWLGRTYIDDIVSQNGPTEIGIRPILSAQVIAAWTAFEALAEDLWTQALNARPRLGFVAINAEPKEGDTDDDRSRKLNMRVPIPVWLLQKPGFRVEENMGTLLRSQYNFSKKDGVASAYLAAFPDQRSKIDAIFKSQELHWLGQCRHVLVHKAGRVDKEFKDRMRAHPQFGNSSIGESVPLDGDRVIELAGYADAKGRELIEFVDSWLKANRA